MSIYNLEIGEIVNIKGRDWILTETTHKNGRIEWEQPTLILLDKIIKGINRKSYFKKRDMDYKLFNKSFKGIKLKINKKVDFSGISEQKISHIKRYENEKNKSNTKLTPLKNGN